MPEPYQKASISLARSFCASSAGVPATSVALTLSISARPRKNTSGGPPDGPMPTRLPVSALKLVMPLSTRAIAWNGVS